MRPRISELVEWKLDRYGEVMIDGVDVEKVPVSQKVQALISDHRSLNEAWTDKAREMRNDSERYYVPGFEEANPFSIPSHLDRDTYRRARVADEVVADLREVHEELEPRKAALDLSFDDTLNMVLEQYNLYALEMNVGWE